MHDIKDIRLRPEYYKRGIEVRGQDPSVVDEMLRIDVELRAAITNRQAAQEKKNQFTALMGELKRLDKEMRIAEMNVEVMGALEAAFAPYLDVIEQIVNELKEKDKRDQHGSDSENSLQ